MLNLWKRGSFIPYGSFKITKFGKNEREQMGYEKNIFLCQFIKEKEKQQFQQIKLKFNK